MRRRRSQSGQVAILFALVFTFMFVMFAFVVDFAHLINNKINLQIAADSAAYAGAAWQARIMNRMAAVNYHLRQDLKEFAMRVNVTHLRHNRNFPRGGGFYNGGDQLPRGFFPMVCQQAHGYVANSGLRYASDTNLCRNASPDFGGLPPIVVPPVIAAFDPFAVAIAAQIRKIQEAADRECRAAAGDNRRLVEHLKAVYENRSNFHVQQMKELEGYLNQLANERGPFTKDNPGGIPLIQTAFQSALRNLSPSNNTDFRMLVLQPETGEYIRLQDNRIDNASIGYFDFTVAGSGCVGQPKFLDGINFSAGMYKENAIITYFAVKLISRPDMLFMPQAWAEAAFPTLEAFAAAKPFGSRIGPQPIADQRIPVANRPGNNNRLLNFSFKPNDPMGIMNAKMMAFFDALHPFNSASRPDGNQNTGWPDPAKENNIRTPLQAIRAPTIFDAAFFTIFPDPGGNANNDYLEPQYAEVLYPDYLEAAGPDNTIIQTPEPRTTAYFPAGVGSKNRGTGWIQINAGAGGGGGPYGNYAEEDVGSHSVVGASALPIVGGKEAEFGFATKDMMHSGWAPEGRPGRIGYSVKFIGMDALRRTLQVTLDQSGQRGCIANPPTGDVNLDNIYH